MKNFVVYIDEIKNEYNLKGDFMKYISLIMSMIFIVLIVCGCDNAIEETINQTIGLNENSMQNSGIQNNSAQSNESSSPSSGIQNNSAQSNESSSPSSGIQNNSAQSGESSSPSSGIQNNSAQSGENDRQKLPQRYLIKNFPMIYQLPELPTGCEITALTMVLNYYGLNADKMTMATEYLPKNNYYVYYKNGIPFGNDLDNYFLGDPTTAYGCVCGAGALVTAANNYLENCKSKIRAKDITGSSPEELYRLVAGDTPVVVMTTIEMVDRIVYEGWYTEDGKYVNWSQSDHGVVLIGYTDDAVIVADPLLGQVNYSKAQFEKVFASRGGKCVILN